MQLLPELAAKIREPKDYMVNPIMWVGHVIYGIKMKFKLSKDTYCRTSGDVLFWNRRSDALRIYDLHESMYDLFSYVGIKVEDAVARLVARNRDINRDLALSDLMGIVNDLYMCGIVVVEDGDSINMPNHKSKKPVENIDDEREVLPSVFFRRNSLPQDIHIDLTDDCTEQCVHCYVPQGKRRYLRRMYVEKLLREFREIQGLNVYLTGGECMLHPDFEDICRLCQSLDLNIIILTNLTCCSERRIDFLKEIDPYFLNVSLYSMKPEEHDSITQIAGSWEKTVKALLRCQKAGVHCRISAPLLRQNQGAFCDLQEFANNHAMQFVATCEIIARSDHDITNIDNACSITEFEKALMSSPEIFDRGWGLSRRNDQRICDVGELRLYVNANGDYYPCDSMYKYVLGNVESTTLKEVWYGSALKKLRELKVKDLQECANCSNRNYCKMCIAANFNATGNIYNHPPWQCEYASIIKKVYDNGIEGR